MLCTENARPQFPESFEFLLFSCSAERPSPQRSQNLAQPTHHTQKVPKQEDAASLTPFLTTELQNFNFFFFLEPSQIS